MAWLGSGYYEEGEEPESPDIVLFGVNPYDEAGDLQGEIHKYGHEAESWDKPHVYPEHKGKIVKAVKEFGQTHARRGRAAALGALGLGPEGEEEEEEEEGEEKDIFGEGPLAILPPPPPRGETDLAALDAPLINQTSIVASKIGALQRMNGWITHANIGVELEDLTDKEKRELEIYVAKKIKLWLNLRGKRRFLRKTFGGIKLKHGELTKGMAKKLEARKQRQHGAARTLLDDFQNNRLDDTYKHSGISERENAYNHFYNAIANDSTVSTSARGALDSGIYHSGLAFRMYSQLYGMNKKRFEARKVAAMDHFENEFGLPFREFGAPRDSEDVKNGTICLFPANDKNEEPYAIMSNYLLNPKYSNKVTIAASTLGSGLKGKHVTEGGWMVTLNNEDGVALKGKYGKEAHDQSVMLFSDIHIPTTGTSSLGDDAEIGSPITIHVESKKPSVPSNDGLDHFMSFTTNRFFSNGETYGLSIKSATREVSVKDGLVTISSNYII